MLPIISICIPTFNRPDLLRQTLWSCVRQMELFARAEICIADNSDNEDSEKTVADISAQYPNALIRYFRHQCNIGLDANMLYVARMAKSEYVLWLGDDDFLENDALAEIFNYIEKYKPDFMALNASYCSSDMSFVKGIQIDIKTDRIITSPVDFFAEFWGNMPFGTLVVRSDGLVSFSETKYSGTFHSYSAYVLSYLEAAYGRKQHVSVVVVAKPLVKLRSVVKTWKNSAIEVYYRGIPAWFGAFETSSTYGKKALELRVQYEKGIYSLRYLLSMRLTHGAGWNMQPAPLRRFHVIKFRLVRAIPVKLLRMARFLFGAIRKHDFVRAST